MEQSYTRSQQLAVLAARSLTDLTNQGQGNEAVVQPLQEFFRSCGVEPVPSSNGLFQEYALTREHLKLIGTSPPERLPHLPLFPDQFARPLACAAVGMVVVRAFSNAAGSSSTYTLGEVEEVRNPQGVGSILRVGTTWYNEEGTPTTAKGTPKTNAYEVLEPVTPAVWAQLERQELYQKLTGYSLSVYGKGMLVELPLGALRALVSLADSPQGLLLLESLPALFQLVLDTPPVDGAAFETLDLNSAASTTMGGLADMLGDGCAALAEALGMPVEQVLLMLLETVCQREEVSRP